MAYLLSFDESNDYVDIPPLPVMSNFDIIMDFSNTGNVQTIIGSNTPSDVESNNSHFRIGVSSTGKVLVLNGTETIESSSSVNGGDIRTVTYSVRNHTGGFSGTAELFLEGVKEGATTSFRGACLANSTIKFLGRSVSSDQGARNFTGGALRRLRVIDYDTPSNSRDYLKQSLIGGNDTTYDEQDNGLDGTLQNFPTDNSQWVFYSDASGFDADVAYTVSSPTFSASASATLPSPQADIAFTVSPPSVSSNASASLPNPIANANVAVSAPNVSVAATASLPQPSSDIAFTVSTPSITVNASSTLPGYNATVSFTVISPSVSVSASATLPSPIADINYTVSTPTVNALAIATLPNPASDVAFSVSSPTVSASATATEPNFNASVAFAVNSPGVSISTSATLPKPESTVNFTVSPPSVSVVAIVGGIAIIVDDETNIKQRVLSNNINAPILSNNING